MFEALFVLDYQLMWDFIQWAAWGNLKGGTILLVVHSLLLLWSFNWVKFLIKGIGFALAFVVTFGVLIPIIKLMERREKP